MADGISEMKKSVEGVTNSISDLQSICQQLRKRQTTKIVTTETTVKPIPDRSGATRAFRGPTNAPDTGGIQPDWSNLFSFISITIIYL